MASRTLGEAGREKSNPRPRPRHGDLTGPGKTNSIILMHACALSRIVYLISLEIERSDLVAQAVYLERSGDHHPIDSQEGSLGRMLGDLCLESWFSSQTQTSPWVLVELRTRESPSPRRKIQKSTGFPGIITYDPPNSCSKRPAPWHAMAIEFQHRIQNSEQKSCLGHPSRLSLYSVSS